MPFEPYRPLPFTAACVGRLNPFISGVYGLFKKDRWIYIGKGNLRRKLMDHLNGDDPSITIQAPTFFIAEVTRDPDGRERELIEELRPLLGRAEAPGAPADWRGAGA